MIEMAALLEKDLKFKINFKINAMFPESSRNNSYLSLLHYFQVTSTDCTVSWAFTLLL